MFMGGSERLDRRLRRLLNLAVQNRPGLLAVETDGVSGARQFEVDQHQVISELLFANEFHDGLAFASPVGSDQFDLRPQRPVALYAIKTRASAVVGPDRELYDVFRFWILLRLDSGRPAGRQIETGTKYKNNSYKSFRSRHKVFKSHLI